MKQMFLKCGVAVAMVVWTASVATAQTTVALPDTSQVTTMTANVSEQARVIVPASVTFNVTNISVSTAATAVAVTVNQIVLATATKQFKVSLQANAASFTPSVVASPTWLAGDVTWNSAVWTNAAGSAGILSSSAFNSIATCTAGVTACSTSALTFTLAAKPTVANSGSHTLTVRWKFESIGS